MWLDNMRSTVGHYIWHLCTSWPVVDWRKITYIPLIKPCLMCQRRCLVCRYRASNLNKSKRIELNGNSKLRILKACFFFSQGNLCGHCQNVQLPDSRPVEGDRVPEVSLPGVYRLPGQVPRPWWSPEAGTESVLSMWSVTHCTAVRWIDKINLKIPIWLFCA